MKTRQHILNLCKEYGFKLEKSTRANLPHKIVDSQLNLVKYCRNFTQCEEAISILLEKKDEFERTGQVENVKEKINIPDNSIPAYIF